MTATGAAHLVSSLKRKPFSPDAIRYHADRNHIQTLRTTGGVRLFRAEDVRRLVETLAVRGER